MSLKSRLPFEVKEISEQGTFEGLLSPYGNVDAGGDIIEPGAFTKTLQDRGNTRPLMWEHREPIGELALDDRSDGLWVRGTLLMDLPEAKKAYLLLKARIAKGLSIGFKAIKAPIEGGIRHLKEIKLFEGSIVMFPMNELAQVISVKAAGAAGEDKADFNTELARLQTLEAFVQMPSALWAALRSVVWADLSREEKIAATATVLEQFTEGFTAFFPVSALPLPPAPVRLNCSSRGMSGRSGRWRSMSVIPPKSSFQKSSLQKNFQGSRESDTRSSSSL